MLPYTNILKSRVETAIKNGIDISNLIEDVNLRNVNLSRAIIKKLNIRNRDISGCNFSNCVLGDPEVKLSVSFVDCKMQHCNFEGAKFIGVSWIRSCDAQFCNFMSADVSKVSYANTNFLGGRFCEAIIRIGTKEGLNCKFPVEMFENLTRGWGMKLKAEYTNETQV